MQTFQGGDAGCRFSLIIKTKVGTLLWSKLYSTYSTVVAWPINQLFLCGTHIRRHTEVPNPDSDSSIARDRTASPSLSLCPRTVRQGISLWNTRRTPWEVKHSHGMLASDTLGAKWEQSGSRMMQHFVQLSWSACVCVCVSKYVHRLFMNVYPTS